MQSLLNKCAKPAGECLPIHDEDGRVNGEDALTSPSQVARGVICEIYLSGWIPLKVGKLLLLRLTLLPSSSPARNRAMWNAY
jgi:hypothetical protein